MYKSIINFFAIGVVLALSWQACSGIDYDGEYYSKEGDFEGIIGVFCLKNTWYPI